METYDYQKAIESFDKATELDPSSFIAWKTQQSLRQYDDALKCYQKALDIDPDIEEAQQLRDSMMKRIRIRGSNAHRQ